jgi:hypothetical protein
MLFAFPYAWFGAATLAGLVAVYVFRNRFRQRPVSSLMLWRQVLRPRQGGLRRDTLSLPPLFYIELAALAALVAAAAAPQVLRPSLGSLIVVFDASASMAARGPDGVSAQARAAQALRREVARRNYMRVRLLAAGVTGPEGVAVTHPALAAARLEQVVCVAGTDTLSQTLARAGEISEPGDQVLVLTDRPPPAGQDENLRARWRAVGLPLENVAITYADRSWRADGTEALLVEVTGFGLTRERVRVTVAGLGRESAPLFTRDVAVAEAKPSRLVVELPPGTGPIQVSLPEDALSADNRALLLSQKPRPVAVAVRLKDERLRSCVRRAVEATGRALFEAGQPQLVFVDGGAERSDAPCWQVALCEPVSPRLVRGPYLTDHAQPLLEGVSFDGLVWAVGTNALPGRGLAFAGNVPLVALDASARRTPVVRVLAGSAQDTLFQSAAWPVLVWNVLAACAEAQPGPAARNLRVGEQALFALAKGEERAVFETPSGERVMRARGGRVAWRPSEPGLYRLRLEDAEAGRFAVNLFAAGEADLRRGASGAWGGDARGGRLAQTHRSYAWLAGLAALALLALHHMAVSRHAAGGSLA